MALASIRSIDQWGARSKVIAATLSVVALSAAAVAGIVAGAVEPTFIRAELALVLMAIAAGLFASVTTTRAGTTLVVNPAVCFSYAALLSYGVIPAIIAQLASVVALAWRTGMAPLHAVAKGFQFSASLLTAALVLKLAGFGPEASRSSWTTLAGALAVIAGIVAWLLV